jgi:putative salt-induced outer membrane protein YdiY
MTGDPRRPGILTAATVLTLLLPGLTAPAHARAKTDVVTLKNGNQITCEIVSLHRGKLKVKTDDMGTVSIEWDKIESLAATGLFEIEDLAGRLFYGPLETLPEEGLQVATATGIETLPLLSVVRLMYIEASFWKRLSGSIDIGFGYTKSSDLAQFNGDVSLRFNRPTFIAELTASSYLQRQQDVEDTTRNSLVLGYTRIRENRQFVLGQLSALQNRELGYDLRAGVTGAYGKFFLRSQGNELLGAAGLYVNQEVPVDGETVTNLEALLAFDWANFSYDFPKTDIEVKTILILGLTDWGRYRVDVDARFDRELFSDFHLVVKGFYNFDSNPPTEGAARDDYQVSLALGYKF